MIIHFILCKQEGENKEQTNNKKDQTSIFQKKSHPVDQKKTPP